MAIIPDPERRSNDVLAYGEIERVDLEAPVAERLKAAASGELPAIYAEAGLWYDALASISDLIELRPNDAQLRKQRSALLTQVGLPEIGDAGR